VTKKTLPVVSSPTINITLPVSQTKVKYRPFIVKEQKAMLLAQQTNDLETISTTIKDVVSACTFGTIDYSKIPVADLAYFFLQLRISSVGPEVRFGLRCEHCSEENIVNMSLDAVTVDTSQTKDTVMISDTVGIKFRYPSVEDTFQKGGKDKTIEMIYSLLIQVFDEEQVYEKQDFTLEEFSDWVDGLTDSSLVKIKEWIDNLPELTHRIDFTCVHCRKENSKLLGGLHNFFRLGNDT
jgi:T4 bacteriophage base plate protein